MSSIKDYLHPETAGMKLVNVKFFRGDKRLITAEEFREQLCAAAEYRRNHKDRASSEAPRSSQPKTNIREFVANL